MKLINISVESNKQDFDIYVEQSSKYIHLLTILHPWEAEKKWNSLEAYFLS